MMYKNKYDNNRAKEKAHVENVVIQEKGSYSFYTCNKDDLFTEDFIKNATNFGLPFMSTKNKRHLFVPSPLLRAPWSAKRHNRLGVGYAINGRSLKPTPSSLFPDVMAPLVLIISNRDLVSEYNAMMDLDIDDATLKDGFMQRQEFFYESASYHLNEQGFTSPNEKGSYKEKKDAYIAAAADKFENDEVWMENDLRDDEVLVVLCSEHDIFSLMKDDAVPFLTSNEEVEVSEKNSTSHYLPNNIKVKRVLGPTRQRYAIENIPVSAQSNDKQPNKKKDAQSNDKQPDEKKKTTLKYLKATESLFEVNMAFQRAAYIHDVAKLRLTDAQLAAFLLSLRIGRHQDMVTAATKISTTLELDDKEQLAKMVILAYAHKYKTMTCCVDGTDPASIANNFSSNTDMRPGMYHLVAYILLYGNTVLNYERCELRDTYKAGGDNDSDASNDKQVVTIQSNTDPLVKILNNGSGGDLQLTAFFLTIIDVSNTLKFKMNGENAENVSDKLKKFLTKRDDHIANIRSDHLECEECEQFYCAKKTVKMFIPNESSKKPDNKQNIYPVGFDLITHTDKMGPFGNLQTNFEKKKDETSDAEEGKRNKRPMYATLSNALDETINKHPPLETFGETDDAIAIANGLVAWFNEVFSTVEEDTGNARENSDNVKNYCQFEGKVMFTPTFARNEGILGLFFQRSSGYTDYARLLLRGKDSSVARKNIETDKDFNHYLTTKFDNFKQLADENSNGYFVVHNTEGQISNLPVTFVDVTATLDQHDVYNNEDYDGFDEDDVVRFVSTNTFLTEKTPPVHNTIIDFPLRVSSKTKSACNSFKKLSLNATIPNDTVDSFQMPTATTSGDGKKKKTDNTEVLVSEGDIMVALQSIYGNMGMPVGKVRKKFKRIVPILKTQPQLWRTLQTTSPKSYTTANDLAVQLIKGCLFAANGFEVVNKYSVKPQPNFLDINGAVPLSFAKKTTKKGLDVAEVKSPHLDQFMAMILCAPVKVLEKRYALKKCTLTQFTHNKADQPLFNMFMGFVGHLQDIYTCVLKRGSRIYGRTDTRLDPMTELLRAWHRIDVSVKERFKFFTSEKHIEVLRQNVLDHAMNYTTSNVEESDLNEGSFIVYFTSINETTLAFDDNVISIFREMATKDENMIKNIKGIIAKIPEDDDDSDDENDNKAGNTKEAFNVVDRNKEELSSSIKRPHDDVNGTSEATSAKRLNFNYVIGSD